MILLLIGGVLGTKDYYTFVKYNEDTIYDTLKKADFAVLPDGMRPTDKYKSNNRTIKANLAGLLSLKQQIKSGAILSQKIDVSGLMKTMLL